MRVAWRSHHVTQRATTPYPIRVQSHPIWVRFAHHPAAHAARRWLRVAERALHSPRHSCLRCLGPLYFQGGNPLRRQGPRDHWRT